MKLTKKYLALLALLSPVLIIATGCVSSQRVAGKRYNLAGVYTYEEDYTAINLTQNPKDTVFFSAFQPNAGFGNLASSGTIGNIKRVDGTKHSFLFGLLSFQNPSEYEVKE